MKRRLNILLFVVLSGLCTANAQLDPLSTQYIHSQLLINPAYTGVRNAFSLNVMARHQWMGVEGAPVNYNVSVHSPLNKSKVSLGAALNSYQAGPVQNHRLNLYYAYLVKVRYNMILSMGVSANLNNYNLVHKNLRIIDEGDPNFSGESLSSLAPNAGVGLFLYSPSFYLGLSVPQLLENRYKQSDGLLVSQVRRHYYFSIGYGFAVGKDFYLKPSALVRFIESGQSSIDFNAQLMYKEQLSIGCSYRLNQAVAAMLGFRVSKTVKITYSYDMSTGAFGLGKGSHEMTLRFDTDNFLRRNRDRLFQKKKKDETDEAGMRSIRYF